MAKHAKITHNGAGGLTEVKSKFSAEYRRFSVDREKLTKCSDFYCLVETLHNLKGTPFFITYTDCRGDELPINNDDNYMKALSSSCHGGSCLLRMQLQRKGEAPANGFGVPSPLSPKRNSLVRLLSGEGKASPRPRTAIGFPEDFRRVSAIVDVDVVPQNYRRVKLMKDSSSRDIPLGFFIRKGVNIQNEADEDSLSKVSTVFISRLVPGGLAESTGLLAVGDEVIEVNGVDTSGKTIDQVTDMMVANSSNLIITVKPVDQTNTLSSKRRQRQPLGIRHSSPATSTNHNARPSRPAKAEKLSRRSTPVAGDMDEEEEEDEVREHLQ